MLKKLLDLSIFRFCLVGGFGFVVDSTILLLLTSGFVLGPYISRVLSYLVAATLTWYFNRTYTFKVSNNNQVRHEWLRYVVLNAIGGGVNYGVYAAYVYASEVSIKNLLIGVAAGSIIGLAFNYITSKYFVFKNTITSIPRD